MGFKQKRGRPKGSKANVLSEEFQNAVASMQTDELKAKVVNLSKAEQETAKAVVDDIELQDTKAKLKDLSGPYSETLKLLKAQRAYVHQVLAERGTP